MTDPAPRSGDVAHQLTSSLSALLIGLQRLRKLVTDGDRERTVALVDRMEAQVRGMTALLQSLRAPGAPAPPREPGDHS